MSMLFGDPTMLSSLAGRGSYANPHATIAIRDIPTNIKQVMRLCRFYYNQDALLGAIIEKMAEYPVTDLVIEEGGTKLSSRDKDRWERMLNVQLDMREVLRQVNIDKYIFGISARFLHFPFVRYCRPQGTTGEKDFPIKALKELRAQCSGRAGNFVMTVYGRGPDTQYEKEAPYEIIDKKSEARSGVNITRLNPLRLRTEIAPISGQQTWYLMPDERIKDGVTNGVRVIIETTEMTFIEASFTDQDIELNPDRLWIAKAPSQPGLWEGWGVPPLFRVLEDVYYYKILRRANEALAQEHVTPMRIISPAGTGDVSPQRTLNLSDWQNRVRGEIKKFRRDPNHVMVSPVPLNIEQMGGNARVMMVASEMEAAARTIAAGVGCPLELILGGLNWSGASVSLRVLENHFLNDRENCERLLEFIVPKIATYFRLPRVKVRLSDFKMADDVQRQANSINLMVQGFLDRNSVLPELGYDPERVFENLKSEHGSLNDITMADNVAAAHMNTIIQAMEAKAQTLLKYELQMIEEQAAARAERRRLEDIASVAASLREKGYATPIEFEHSARMLQRMSPVVVQQILASWSQSMPMVSQMLAEKLRIMGAMPPAPGPGPAQPPQDPNFDPGSAAGMGMDPGASGPYSDGGGGAPPPPEDDPLPEQRPPQRATSPI